MSTSANPAMQGYSPLTQISAHSALKMAQAAGMIVPPAYIVLTLGRRRPLTIAGLMRATTANTIAWAGIGGAGAYAYLQNQPEDKLVDRVQRLSHNVGQVRTDDYSVIGAAVGALLSPALFLKRAPTPLLVAGGACMGLGAGVWVHFFQSLSKGESVAPDAMVAEAKDIVSDGTKKA